MASLIRRIVVVIAATVALSGCGDDDDPPPAVHYLLCAGVHQIGGDGWIAIIDCDTDSLVDSLGYAGMDLPSQVVGSNRGNYLAVVETGQRPTKIWDMSTRTIATEISGGIPLFIDSENMYCQRSSDSVNFYQMPSFVRDTAIQLRWWFPELASNSRAVFAVHERGPEGHLGDLTQIVRLSFASLSIVDSFSIPDGESALQVADISVRADGSTLYALGRAAPRPPIVAGIDVSSREVLFRKSVTAATGQCKPSPDAKELWVSDPGYLPIFHEPIWPGQILVFDASTGAVLDTIPTLGLDPNPSVRWEVNDIHFVPGMNKAYVNCRPYYGQSRPILVIDTKTKKVTGMIFGDSGRSAFSIAVVPRY